MAEKKICKEKLNVHENNWKIKFLNSNHLYVNIDTRLLYETYTIDTTLCTYVKHLTESTVQYLENTTRIWSYTRYTYVYVIQVPQCNNLTI